MIKKVLYVFAISIVPVIELRGAIPVGASQEVPMWLCFIAAVIGNLLPVPFLILFGGKVLRYFAKFEKFGKAFLWILDLGERKVQKMKKSLFAGLLAFVAIPLPGTGAWTGSLIAITLGLDLKKSFLPIALGVVIAGVIMTLGSFGVVAIFNVFA
ncbi:MAG: small multi-drug export protein [Clostridiales bacterium]|nr:small multi-drug export protein [Candidatus Coliplasma equi]